MPIEKKNVFTLQNASGYAVFSKYCATFGYDPYLHDDKPDCIPDNLVVFSLPAVTHIVMPLTTYPYPPTEVETSTSEEGIKDSEGSTDGIWSPDSEGDTQGLFYFLLYGPLQDAPETTTLITSEKSRRILPQNYPGALQVWTYNFRLPLIHG